MLYGLLNTLFVILCFLSVLIILLQKSKGSLGIIGSAGSGSQMLFGGTGGQDIFQKITWTLVALFLAGSLLLGILKNRAVYESRFIAATEQPAMPADFMANPAGETAPAVPATAVQHAQAREVEPSVSTELPQQ